MVKLSDSAIECSELCLLQVIPLALAVRDCDQKIKLEPDKPDYYLLRATRYGGLMDYGVEFGLDSEHIEIYGQKAAEDLDRAVQSDPGSVRTHSLRARGYRMIYQALLVRNREGDFHQADETRWMVYVEQEGKLGYR